MKLVAYGRVNPNISEVPLKTQKYSCQRFCEQNKYSFESWFEDECHGEKSLLERDGFYELYHFMTNNDIDGILTYDWRRVSTDVGIVAGLKPLFFVSFRKEIDLYTPEGKVNFEESEDIEQVKIGKSMNTLTSMIEDWRDAMSRFKMKDSINKVIEEDGVKRVGSQPYGLETDKQRFENRSRVHEYYPDDRGEEDKFKTAIRILNDFAHNGTSPYHKDVRPNVNDMYDKYGVQVSVIKTIWKYQKTYKEVAEEHRPDLTILF